MNSHQINKYLWNICQCLTWIKNAEFLFIEVYKLARSVILMKRNSKRIDNSIQTLNKHKRLKYQKACNQAQYWAQSSPATLAACV